jgi:hypothetical protein
MPFMPDLEQPTQTWVADRDSAWSAGSALTLVELQRPQFLLFAAAALVGLPWLLAAAGTQGTAFGLVLGLVLAGFLLGSCAAISLWGKVRYFRRVLPPGHRFTCRFGAVVPGAGGGVGGDDRAVREVRRAPRGR